MDVGGVLSLDSDYCIPVLGFDDNINILIPERSEWQNDTLPYSGPSIYMDGSKTDNGTGSGVFSEELNIHESYCLHTGCSIFQTEILAIQKAVEVILGLSRPVNDIVTIYVDR